MKLDKKQLEKVLESVTADVAAMLKSETEEVSLNKADPGEETPAEKTPAGSSTESSAPADAAPEAPHDEAAEASAAAAPADAAPEASGDPANDAQATPEALQAEYAQLPVEELKMHYMACKSALMQMLGAGADGAGPEASASPEGAPAPEASAPAPEASPEMGKKELKLGDGSGGKITKSEGEDLAARLAKTEAALAEVETLKKALTDKDATIASLEESVGRVADGFKKLLERQGAMRKSVAGVSFIGKPGTPTPAEAGSIDVSSLSKAEVTARLRDISANPKLAKSDRDTINKFYSGQVGIDGVAKLLQQIS